MQDNELRNDMYFWKRDSVCLRGFEEEDIPELEKMLSATMLRTEEEGGIV